MRARVHAWRWRCWWMYCSPAKNRFTPLEQRTRRVRTQSHFRVSVCVTQAQSNTRLHTKYVVLHPYRRAWHVTAIIDRMKVRREAMRERERERGGGERG